MYGKKYVCGIDNIEYFVPFDKDHPIPPPLITNRESFNPFRCNSKASFVLINELNSLAVLYPTSGSASSFGLSIGGYWDEVNGST